MRIAIYDFERGGVYDRKSQQDGFLCTGIAGMYCCNSSGGGF